MSNPFDLNDLGGLMSGLQQRMAQLKAEVAATEVSGEAGGGLVKVTVNGEFETLAVSIQEGALEDREMLEDLIVAAQNDAVRRAKELMASKVSELTGGLPLPPGMLGF